MDLQGLLQNSMNEVRKTLINEVRKICGKALDDLYAILVKAEVDIGKNRVKYKLNKTQLKQIKIIYKKWKDGLKMIGMSRLDYTGRWMVNEPRFIFQIIEEIYTKTPKHIKAINGFTKFVTK